MTETAIFAGGCFWCTEAIFQNLHGVISVEPGYIGGSAENPTYEQVCSNTTGHVEVAQITFNPKEVLFQKLLEIFFQTHDPTSMDKQGSDTGSQYRSVIFYHNEKQKQITEKFLKQIQNNFERPIVTEIKSLEKFYPAENYHQDYYKKNPFAPYCLLVIRPKLKKLKL